MAPFAQHIASSWADALAFAAALDEDPTGRLPDSPRWIFRGQGCCQWPLSTSLERAALNFAIDFAELPGIESDLLTKFRRNVHLYLANYPERRDTLGFLALMQHHGAPTRLLDWSYSFHAAAFFSLESACADHGCAVWAVNYSWCNKAAKAIVQARTGNPALEDEFAIQEPGVFDDIFMSDERLSFVYQVTPSWLSERLIIQQGTFLCPGDVSKSLQDNMFSLPGADLAQNVVQVVIPGNLELRKRALAELYRMNMTRAALFPGLDGFASSFRTQLPFKWRRR